MKNKKVIILIVLSLLAVVSLLYGVLTPPGGRSAVRPRAAIAPNRESPAQQTGAEIDQVKRRAVRSGFTSWKRNPFISKGVTGERPVGLNLNGIAWDKKIPKAMIDDVIVKKGDRVGLYKVIDIKKDRVILNDGTQDLELRLK